MTNQLNVRQTTQLQNYEYQQELVSKNAAIATDDWSFFTKELLDGLPQVWTRGLLYFLVIFVAIILPWSMLYKVDETGAARGRIEPKGKTVKLDSPVSGTVKDINIKEGDVVKNGQKILGLYTDLLNKELQQGEDKLKGFLNRGFQLKLSKQQLVVALTTQQQQNQSQALEKQSQIDQAQQNLMATTNVYQLQKEEKITQVNQAKQNLEYSKTASNLAQSSLTSALREKERYRQLWQQGVVPEINVIEKQDIVQEKQKLYKQSQSDIQQSQLRLAEQQSNYQRIVKQGKADITQAQLRLNEQKRSYQTLTQTGKLALLKIEEQQKSLETEITTLNAEIAQTKRQIESLKIQLGQRELKANVSGTVFQLPIQKAGAVVQPGTLIAEIAPLGSPLIIRAQMMTNESGSLRKGLPVKLKFDAYPFQEHGIVEGEVIAISPTATEVDTANGKVSVYNLEISLQQNCIKSGNKCIPFRPGDTAMAEVIVRQRRIIDFLIDPFKQLQQGGLQL
jgi:HlyD family secretion protein